MFSKHRAEFLSDAIYAVVMTLLVLQIRLPEFEHLDPSNAQIWYEVIKLGPLMLSYIVSFVVLITFWISHNAIFEYFLKEGNRMLVYLNMLHLAFIAFIPFAAGVLGTYSNSKVAALLFGLTMFFQAATFFIVHTYATTNPQLLNEKVDPKNIRLSRIRNTMPIVFSLLGMLVAFQSTIWAQVIFMIPILFNLIPGILYQIEKIFGIEF